jgi:hypothetical protein
MNDERKTAKSNFYVITVMRATSQEELNRDPNILIRFSLFKETETSSY